MSELLIKNIFPKEIKKGGPEIIPAKQEAELTPKNIFETLAKFDKQLPIHEKSGNGIELFDNSKGEKKEDKEKAEKELSPEANYVLNYTSLGKLVVLLEENPDLKLAKSRKRKTGSKDIEKLENAGAIEIDGGLEIKTHREKLRVFFKETTAAQILDLYKKNPEIKVMEISGILNISESYIWREIERLSKASVLKKTKHSNSNRNIISFSKEQFQDESSIIIKRIKKPTSKDFKQRIEEIDGQILNLLDNTPTLEKNVIFEKLKNYPSHAVRTRIKALHGKEKLEIFKKIIEGEGIIFLRKPNHQQSAINNLKYEE